MGVFQENWKAGKDHCDLENQKTFQNRYLLIGRPQIGKTGVFLHVAYSLWKLSGKGPTQERTQIMEIEECDESDEEDEGGTEARTRRPGLMTNMQQYPCFDALVKLKLGKATPSTRYGDPNVKALRDWYLVEGRQYPYPDLEKKPKPARISQLKFSPRWDSKLRCTTNSAQNHFPPQQAFILRNQGLAQRTTRVTSFQS